MKSLCARILLAVLFISGILLVVHLMRPSVYTRLNDSTALFLVEGEPTGSLESLLSVVTPGPRFRCTAVAIEKNDTGYVFVTATHCACEDDAANKKAAFQKSKFYVSPGDRWASLIEAKPIACGYRGAGDDFALFQVDTARQFSIMPLGEDPKLLDKVVLTGAPAGYKQTFFGTVSSADLGTPVDEDEAVNWTNYLMVQIPGITGGASGAPIVCLDQEKICAFEIGSIRSVLHVAVQVSRLKVFMREIGNHEYPYGR